ncbi:MAG: cohesin domain-containing protein [Crocinitomicaceae bacterium]|nr:cohesin domain-containing protein [Crocinitomicaceae bacterium]
MMNKKIVFTLGLSTFLISQSSLAISLNFFPSSQVVELGDTVSVNLRISDLGEMSSPSLGAFDLNINFDSSIVDLTDVGFEDQLSLFNTPSFNFFIPENDRVNLVEISNNSPLELDMFQETYFVLASLDFNTVSSGSTLLTITDAILSDANGIPLDFDVLDSSNTVVSSSASVPEKDLSRVILLLPLFLLGNVIKCHLQ